MPCVLPHLDRAAQGRRCLGTWRAAVAGRAPAHRAGNPRVGAHCRSAVPSVPASSWTTTNEPRQRSLRRGHSAVVREGGALLRRVAAGEAVTDQVDWPHVEEIEHVMVSAMIRMKSSNKGSPERRRGADQRTACSARRYGQQTTKTQAELTTAQGQAEAATARAAAAVEAEQAIRQAERERRARGRWARLRAALRSSGEGRDAGAPPGTAGGGGNVVGRSDRTIGGAQFQMAKVPKENPVMRYLLIAGCVALVGCNTMNGRTGEDTQRSERPLPAPEPAPYYPAADPLNSR